MYYLIPSICLQELYLASATCHCAIFAERCSTFIVQGFNQTEMWMDELHKPWCSARIAAESHLSNSAPELHTTGTLFTHLGV